MSPPLRWHNRGNPMKTIQKAQAFTPTVPLLSIVLALVCLLSAGCSATLLPMVKGSVESPWESFDQAKQAFDRVIPYQTSEEELRSLNFAPFQNPNLEIISYLAVINRFMPSSSFRKEDLPKGIQDCIENNNLCYGYELKISQVQNKRLGNVFLDLFNFKRRTHKTGWEFNALIVIRNSLVVYKLWSGKPQIDEFSDSKNPLGPLQESETVINTVGPAVF